MASIYEHTVPLVLTMLNSTTAPSIQSFLSVPYIPTSDAGVYFIVLVPKLADGRYYVFIGSATQYRRGIDKRINDHGKCLTKLSPTE